MTAIAPQFSDTVHAPQQVFRAVLTALSQPGRAAPLALAPAGPLHPAQAALALALLDDTTPVWLDPQIGSQAVVEYLKFHTGAPIVRRAADAAFALCAALPDLGAFPQGTAEYPDRSATVILAVPALTGGAAVTLTGPGIETSVIIAPAGLATAFWTQRARHTGAFPAGLDILLVDDTAVIGLPRTTKATLA